MITTVCLGSIDHQTKELLLLLLFCPISFSNSTIPKLIFSLNLSLRNSLVVQWLGVCAFTAKVLGSVPGQETDPTSLLVQFGGFFFKS